METLKSTELRDRPKVCISALNYPPERTGIATYTGSLAAGLASAGYDVAVHVAHPHYPQWKIYEGYGKWKSEAKSEHLSVTRRLHYVPSPPRGLRRLLSELTYGIRLIFARWDSPQVIIALSPPLFSTALLFARIRIMPRRPRTILWVQDIYSLGLAETGEGGGIAQRIVKGIEKRTVHRADQVVVIHERFVEYLSQEFGLPMSKTLVMRNWTHLPPSPPIDRDVAKEALGWPVGITLAVHTGNMGAKQGLDNLVDAARMADETNAPVHFILVGDGGERRRLEEYGVGVRRLSFADPLSNDQYLMALAAADVLLVNEKPGVSEMAMPSKLTSYFNSGRPVVAATDLGGITASEVCAAGAGLVVPAGRPAALLEAVVALGADPQAAASFGASGRKYREEVLDEEVAICRWKHHIDSVSCRK